MSKSYDEQEVREGYVRSPSHQRSDPPSDTRDYSPEYYSGGGGGPLVYASSRGPVPVTGSYTSGATTVEGANRSYYEPDSPLFPRNTNALQVPPSMQYLPRSVPPQALAVSRPRSRSRSRSRPRTPLRKARHAIDHNFSQSSSGFGVGLLGAVVGGLAAREVSDAAQRNRNRKAMEKGTYHCRPHHETEKARVISTVVGALVGGLGANALEKRFEVAREQSREQQLAWDRRWGREGDLPHNDTGKEYERNHGRGRSRGRRHYDEWENDYLYDARRPARLRSEERYQYRRN